MLKSAGKNNKGNKMIVAIKIRSSIGVRKDVKGALNVLKLRKVYVCKLFNESETIKGLLNKVSDVVAFGEIDKETLKELIAKRGRLPGDKPAKTDEKFIDDLIAGKVKLEDKNMKPFFRLHPPIGGFRKSTKKRYPQGVLGENKKIGELIRRML